MTPMQGALTVATIALAVSLVGNAVLVHDDLEQRAQLAKVEGQRDVQESAANACTNSVDGFAKAATAQVAAAATSAAAAKAAAAKRQTAADEIMSTPASVPGDDCKSAQERVDRWLTRRAQK